MKMITGIKLSLLVGMVYAQSIQETLEIFRFENVKTFPGLRCKSKWWYVGKYRFQKARYLFPFTNELKYIPSFLKGKARSIIAIGQKKIN